ncbi:MULTISPECIES: hypothetical protein [Bacillus]|nr:MULTISPECIES: hypothetical protein [Bacillus]
MKKSSDKQAQQANVEFGSEFGDINASKIYEIPFMNDKKSTKENKKRN